ncbi:MAG: hypothetical protein AAB348_01785 [Patescibacteria group bacterium]
MNYELVLEIESLLNKIFIFSEEDKNGILNRLKNEPEADKISKIKKILEETIEYQGRLIERKISENPSLLEKLEDKKKELIREALNKYQAMLKEDDRSKINTILTRIDSL